MKCWKCNSQLSDDSSFCSYCGAVQNRNSFCLKCDAELVKDASFCMCCGAARMEDHQQNGCDSEIREHKDTENLQSDSCMTEQRQTETKDVPKENQRRTFSKKIPVSTLISGGIAILLAAVLLITNMGFLSGSSSDPSIMSSGKKLTFSTPESVMGYYVDCIKEGDTKGALQAFAVSEMAKGYDFAYNLEYLQLFPINYLSPGDDSKESYYYPLNEGNLYQEAARETVIFSYGFLLPENYITKSCIPADEMEESAAELQSEILDTSKLSRITLARTDYAKPEIQDSTDYQENSIHYAARYGADSIKEYTALYELDGKYYYGGFSLVEYDGSWKIMSLGSNISEIDRYTNIMETTPDEYIRRLTASE